MDYIKYSKDTIRLLKIIQKNKFLKLDFKEIYNNSFLIKLYKDMKKNIKKDINYKLIKIVEEPNNDIFNKNNYIIGNNFLSEDNALYILKKNKYTYIFYYKNIEIIYSTKDKLKGENIPKVIEHMLIIINLMKNIFKNNHKQKIVYFETLNKKKFPKKNEILDKDNVNSGVTYLEDNHSCGDIILYRSEEVLKVLIHELIHSHLIDFKLISSKNSKLIDNLFCSNYKILLNEAFTETLATIINLFYINIIKEDDEDELNKMLLNEIYYSNYISSKIFNYYKINSINQIIKKNGTCNNNFMQKTNVFSYYILKNIFLSSLDYFSKLIKKYSKNYKINNENFIIEIIELINNKKYDFDKRLIKINDKNNSLRLCLYELDIYVKK
jgi:hypothetical protein